MDNQTKRTLLTNFQLGTYVLDIHNGYIRNDTSVPCTKEMCDKVKENHIVYLKSLVEEKKLVDEKFEEYRKSTIYQDPVDQIGFHLYNSNKKRKFSVNLSNCYSKRTTVLQVHDVPNVHFVFKQEIPILDDHVEYIPIDVEEPIIEEPIVEPIVKPTWEDIIDNLNIDESLFDHIVDHRRSHDDNRGFAPNVIEETNYYKETTNLTSNGGIDPAP